MSAARRRFLILVVVCLSITLISCGGGTSSGTKVSAQQPIFTTLPSLAAAQGLAYSYPVAADDPSGGTVSFAPTSPSGAAVSSNTVNWTPSAAQSRVSNSFTVTATTSEGASATQSWLVSPTGVVTVNWITTYWAPGGPMQVPISASSSLAISAVAPQPDGSLLVLKGAYTAPGVISIAGVPAGNYWLTFGGLTLLPPLATANAAYWTSASNIDAGRDAVGPPPTAVSPGTVTTFDLNLSGLDSVAVPTAVSFSPDNAFFYPTFIDDANSPTLSVSLGIASTIDWSQVTTGFVTQYEPSTLGPLNDGILGPAVTISNLSLINGATNVITQTLQPAVPASLNFTVQGSQWASSLSNTAPVAPAYYASGFAIQTQPFVTGINAQGQPLAGDIVLASSTDDTGLNFGIQPFAVCDTTGFLVNPGNSQTAILTDQSLGTLQYSDPFPSAWTRTENFCQEAVVPVPVPNSTEAIGFALVTSTTTAPSNSPLVPIVGPVQGPTINSADLFTAATLTTTTPALSWSAPATGSPYGYRVAAYVLNTSTGIPVYQTAGVFYTSQTSTTLPPLSGGNVYVFAITALVDGVANVQTSPFRSALPTGYASVVSAPMTISAGAERARIQGDAWVIRQFSQPQPAHAQAAQPGITLRRN